LKELFVKKNLLFHLYWKGYRN